MALQWFSEVSQLVVGVAWPAAATVAAFAFRKPLGKLLDRSHKVTVAGMSVEAHPEQQPQQIEKPASTELLPRSYEAANEPPVDPLLQPMEERLIAQAEAEIPDLNRRLRWMVRLWAVAEMGRTFEVLYRSIFGSQLAALRTLNGLPQAHWESFRPFYDGAAASGLWTAVYPSTDYQTWGRWLLAVNLITWADEAAGTVEITLLGRRFLAWVVESGLPESRPA